jgi:hypothetical protein
MLYQVGTAIRDVTPSREFIASGKIWLWGYGNRESPCTGVHTPLSARALVISDREGSSVVLVTLDVGMLAPETTDRIRSRTTTRFGVPAENICINVSHTHGAPVTVSVPTWQLGVAVAQAEYTDLLEKQAIGAIEDAWARRQPARLTWARGKTQIGRDRHFKGEQQFYDSTLDVLTASSVSSTACVRSEARTTIATVFITPCHPVCNGDLNKIYADFPGIARDEVELEVGGTALFLQGYAGTCVPELIDGHKATDTQVGHRLAAEVIAAVRNHRHTLRGPVRARMQTIELPLASVDPASLPSTKAWSAMLRQQNPDLARVTDSWADHLASLGPSLPTSLPTQQQVICIGTAPDDCYLIASSHEVSMDFAPRVRSLWPCSRVSVIGYSNSQFSYLPSSEVMRTPYAATKFPQGIVANYNYTAALSFLWYAHPGPLAVEADDAFMQGFAALRDAVPVARDEFHV